VRFDEHGRAGIDEMRRVAGSRRDRVGVLRASPALDTTVGATIRPVTRWRVEEVRQLLVLVDRDLLSEEEFELQMLKMFRLCSPEWSSASGSDGERSPLPPRVS
jgi:hypothetical protein